MPVVFYPYLRRAAERTGVIEEAPPADRRAEGRTRVRIARLAVLSVASVVAYVAARRMRRGSDTETGRDAT